MFFTGYVPQMRTVYKFLRHHLLPAGLFMETHFINLQDSVESTSLKSEKEIKKSSRKLALY